MYKLSSNLTGLPHVCVLFTIDSLLILCFLYFLLSLLWFDLSVSLSLCLSVSLSLSCSPEGKEMTGEKLRECENLDMKVDWMLPLLC